MPESGARNAASGLTTCVKRTVDEYRFASALTYGAARSEAGEKSVANKIVATVLPLSTPPLSSVPSRQISQRASLERSFRSFGDAEHTTLCSLARQIPAVVATKRSGDSTNGRLYSAIEDRGSNPSERNGARVGISWGSQQREHRQSGSFQVQHALPVYSSAVVPVIGEHPQLVLGFAA